MQDSILSTHKVLARRDDDTLSLYTGRLTENLSFYNQGGDSYQQLCTRFENNLSKLQEYLLCDKMIVEDKDKHDLYSNNIDDDFYKSLVSGLNVIDINRSNMFIFSTFDRYSLDHINQLYEINILTRYYLVNNVLVNKLLLQSKLSEQRDTPSQRDKYIKETINFCIKHLDEINDLVLSLSQCYTQASKNSRTEYRRFCLNTEKEEQSKEINKKIICNVIHFFIQFKGNNAFYDVLDKEMKCYIDVNIDFLNKVDYVPKHIMDQIRKLELNSKNLRTKTKDYDDANYNNDTEKKMEEEEDLSDYYTTFLKKSFTSTSEYLRHLDLFNTTVHEGRLLSNDTNNNYDISFLINNLAHIICNQHLVIYELNRHEFVYQEKYTDKLSRLNEAMDCLSNKLLHHLQNYNMLVHNIRCKKACTEMNKIQLVSERRRILRSLSMIITLHRKFNYIMTKLFSEVIHGCFENLFQRISISFYIKTANRISQPSINFDNLKKITYLITRDEIFFEFDIFFRIFSVMNQYNIQLAWLNMNTKDDNRTRYDFYQFIDFLTITKIEIDQFREEIIDFIELEGYKTLSSATNIHEHSKKLLDKGALICKKLYTLKLMCDAILYSCTRNSLVSKTEQLEKAPFKMWIEQNKDKDYLSKQTFFHYYLNIHSASISIEEAINKIDEDIICESLDSSNPNYKIHQILADRRNDDLFHSIPFNNYLLEMMDTLKCFSIEEIIHLLARTL